MILNNYWNWKAYVDNHSVPNSVVLVNVGLVNVDGSNFTSMYSTGGNQQNNINMKIRLGAILGDSDTEPTQNDYNVGNSIMSAISQFNTNVSVTSESGKNITVITVTGVNTSSESITIREIGIYKSMYGKYPTEGYTNILFIHSLLETPKAVARNEGFSLTFEWIES